MRVSHVFQALAEPLLYDEIASDRFPAAIANVHLPSVRRRLAHTTRIRIEYATKGEDLTYIQMLNVGKLGWGRCGRTAEETEKTIMVDCGRELLALAASLQAVNERGAEKVFPKLKTIAVGSIYSRTTDEWIRYENIHRAANDFSKSLQSCTVEWDQFIHTLSLDGLCMRDNNGPLTLPFLSSASLGQGPRLGCEVSFHFGANIFRFPFPLGYRIRWVSDIPMEGDWSVPLQQIGKCFVDIFDIREQLAHIHNGPDKAEVDIYCSTPFATPTHHIPRFNGFRLKPHDCNRSISPDEQHTISKWLQTDLEKVWRHQKWEGDKVRWNSSWATMPCRACGSGVPGPKTGTWVTGPWRFEQGMTFEGPGGRAYFGFSGSG